MAASPSLHQWRRQLTTKTLGRTIVRRIPTEPKAAAQALQGEGHLHFLHFLVGEAVPLPDATRPESTPNKDCGSGMRGRMIREVGPGAE